MAEITLVIGAAAYCSDGFPGELKCLVVDPATRAVTHLVIEPKLEHGTAVGLARLVPVDHVDTATREIRLRYTEAEFKDLSPAEETLAEFVPGYEAARAVASLGRRLERSGRPGRGRGDDPRDPGDGNHPSPARRRGR